MIKSRRVRWAGHVAWLQEKYIQDSARETVKETICKTYTEMGE
jgi:hypothetical protein